MSYDKKWNKIRSFICHRHISYLQSKYFISKIFHSFRKERISLKKTKSYDLVFFLAEKGRSSRRLKRLAPRKHSRLARLERIAILLVSSLARLASSAAGGASAHSLPRLGAGFSSPHKKRHLQGVFFYGGEGETRTPAPVTRPTPLAGAPRHQLEYFSMVTI